MFRFELNYDDGRYDEDSFSNMIQKQKIKPKEQQPEGIVLQQGSGVLPSADKHTNGTFAPKIVSHDPKYRAKAVPLKGPEPISKVSTLSKEASVQVIYEPDASRRFELFRKPEVG